MRMSDFIDWLGGQIDADVIPGGNPEVPNMPDKLVIVQRSGGGRMLFDGAYDSPTIQVKCRGGQNDPDDAEDLAREVDTVLLSAEMPTIGGVPVLAFSRAGSPPTPDPWDDASRTVYVCNYAAQVASDL